MPSTAAVGGHPIHPALVPLPIGFLVGALGGDLGYWWTSEPFFARAALWLTAAGVGFGALAAIPGLVDFLTIQRARVHRIGWVHALGNGAVLLLAAASWLLRLGDPAAPGAAMGAGALSADRGAAAGDGLDGRRARLPAHGRGDRPRRPRARARRRG